MTEGAAGRARTRRTPWLGLTGRVIVLAIAAAAAAWLLFGTQLMPILQSFRTVTVGVHNATTETVVVSAVARGGARAFYSVPPSETRLIPGLADEVITIHDADCGILDSHARGNQPPVFLVAEVASGGVTWIDRTSVPAGLEPADTGQACEVP